MEAFHRLSLPYAVAGAVRLIIFHYHYRPGGVRRVIELAVPHILEVLRPAVARVILAGGERPDPEWLERFAARIRIGVDCFVEPAFGYFLEQSASPARIRARVQAGLERLLGGKETAIVWAHNLGVGRNAIFTRCLSAWNSQPGVRLIFHHHDWWFDNRWPRWREIRQSGFNLDRFNRVVFAAEGSIRHALINRADARAFRRHLPGRSVWLPNLTARGARPGETARARARKWLEEKVGHRGPVWLLPSRIVRRKNMAEAILLMRWLRPEAHLIVTGGPSSADEEPYASALEAGARQGRWPVHFGVLRGVNARAPGVAGLMAVSEAVLLTSVMEGFGLPYLEAAAAGRPLIARRLENIAPDLTLFGFRFPQLYREILIPPALFDWNGERTRQQASFERWRRTIPAACRKHLGNPVILRQTGPAPVAFSRLTLKGQLEVLSRSPEQSWKLARSLNPVVAQWLRPARRGELKAAAWPASAQRWLSGPSYARRFAALCAAASRSPPQPGSPAALFDRFAAEKLASANLYPLLWDRSP